MPTKRAEGAGAINNHATVQTWIFDLQRYLSMSQKSLIRCDGAIDGFAPYRIVPTTGLGLRSEAVNNGVQSVEGKVEVTCPM